MTKAEIRKEFESYILGQIFCEENIKMHEIIEIGAFLKTYLKCNFVDEVLESLFSVMEEIEEK